MAFSRQKIWAVFLVAVLIVVVVGTAFHDLSANHDPAACLFCAWLQLHAGLVAAFTLLIFFSSQPIHSERPNGRVHPGHRFFRSRSPPIR